MTENLRTNASQVISDTQNRGYDNKLDASDPKSISITLMSIDEIIVTHLIDTIKPTVVDNGNIRSVPVIYGTPERWSIVRQHGYLREAGTEKAQTPVILLRRIGVDRGALANPSNKYLTTAYQTGWNSRNVYDKFAVLNGIKPSQQYYNVIIPDYVDLQYEFMVWTEYEEQMSDLIGQLQVESDDFWGTRNGYKFRVKVDSFDNQSDIDSTQDRLIRTVFSMKVAAYLIPERMIQKFRISSTTQKSYSVKKTVVMTETIVKK